jgi:hypothetical protein
MTALRAGALIATFCSAAPARGGGFADERRIVAATEAAECRHETLVQFARAVRLRRLVQGGTVIGKVAGNEPVLFIFMERPFTRPIAPAWQFGAAAGRWAEG